MEKQIDGKVQVFGRNSLGGFGGEAPRVRVMFSVDTCGISMEFPGEFSEAKIASIMREAADMLTAPNQKDVEIV